MLFRSILTIAAMVGVASAAPILSFDPANTVVAPSDMFSVDVTISDAVDLFAFQFDVNFDASILAANNGAEGPFLATGGSTFFIPGVIDNAAGTITFNSNTLIGAVLGVNGNGILATLDFTAIGAGTTPLTLSNELLLDSQLNLIQNVTTTSGSVTAVPEPSTALLLLSALGVLLATRWRRVTQRGKSVALS